MAIRQKCMYCGEPVSTNGYCTSCRLSQEFLRKAMNTSAYHFNIGLGQAKARDLSGAVESLRTSLRYNKMNINSRNLLGLVYYEMGEVVPALSHWVMSVNYQPNHNPAVRYLKELRDEPKELEQINESAREFNQALEHAKQHSFDLAVIPLKKAISLNRRFVKGHLLMALIYNEEGRKNLAKKHLSRVLAIDRGNITAERILRGMGEKEEAISRMAEQGIDDAEELFSYYGVETGEGKRPSRKIEPETVGVRRSAKMLRFREVTKARSSNLYMFSGIVIGILILLFLIRPGLKKGAANDADALENSYLKELSTRNAEIAGLQLSVQEAEKKVEKAERDKQELANQIESLGAQIEALRTQIAAGGAALLPDKEEGSSEEGNPGTGDEQTGEDAGENAAGNAGADGNAGTDAGNGDGTVADGRNADQGQEPDPDQDTDQNQDRTTLRGITAQEIEAMILEE